MRPFDGQQQSVGGDDGELSHGRGRGLRMEKEMRRQKVGRRRRGRAGVHGKRVRGRPQDVRTEGRQ